MKQQNHYSTEQIIYLRRQAGMASTTAELTDRFNKHFGTNLSLLAIKGTLVRWNISGPESRQGGTLCWSCKHSIPNHRAGCKPRKGEPTGCSWSMVGKPVDGWNAVPTIVRHSVHGGIKEEPSYSVRQCPMFEKG